MHRARLVVPFLLILVLVVPASLLTAEAGPSSKDAALVLALKKQRLSKVTFEETPFKGVIKWLRVATSKNFHIKHTVLAKAGVEVDEILVNVQFENVTVWNLLEVLLKPHGMAIKVKGNIIFITSKADAYGKPVTKLYGISHITWQKTDFIAGPINLNPSGFIEEEYEPEVAVEDDPLSSGDAVADLIREIILPKAWEENDTWHIKATDRYLVIRAPAAVHARIPRALSIIASMK